jgi:hypothetical protein
MVGRTRGDQVVVFSGEPNMRGRILRLDITDAQSVTLFGELESAHDVAAPAI